MSKGLKPNEITQFKFANGTVVGIRKVSPFLAIELQKAFPPPEPPMQTVNYGEGDIKEANSASPEYAKALADYATEREHRLRKMIIKRGVVMEITDEIKEELSELRAFWKEDNSVDLPTDGDKCDYIIYIAVTQASDLERLVNTILGQGQPTEEGVQAAVESFPGDVSGS